MFTKRYFWISTIDNKWISIYSKNIDVLKEEGEFENGWKT